MGFSISFVHLERFLAMGYNNEKRRSTEADINSKRGLFYAANLFFRARNVYDAIGDVDKSIF